MPVHSWVAAVISGEASWSQGKGAASAGWPSPYIFEEETHMWDRSTFPPCLSYYLGLVIQRQTPSFSMEVFISNSDHEAYAREDHI